MKPQVVTLEGQTFLIGQPIAMFLKCVKCGRANLSFRDRVLGICQHCLSEANVRVGVILVVAKPTASARWN